MEKLCLLDLICQLSLHCDYPIWKMKKFLRVIFIFNISFISLCTFSQTIDTISIYKSEATYGQKIYYKYWFWDGKGFSYVRRRATHQDSLVMFTAKTVYFKYYSKPNGRLILEGKNSPGGSYLDEDVKFYSKKGRLKRIENWGYREKDTCGVKLTVHDAPAPKGVWKFFDKKGRIVKTYTYHIDVISCEPMSYKFIKTTRYYKRTGILLKAKDETIESSTIFDY